MQSVPELRMSDKRERERERERECSVSYVMQIVYFDAGDRSFWRT